MKGVRKPMRMMSKVTAVAVLLASLGSAKAEEGILTGDTRLACEAVLCLATGQRPDECSTSIQRYYSIRADKPSELREKRRNFLKQCPDSDDGIVNSIVSGQCNPELESCGGGSGPIGGGGTDDGRVSQQVQ